MAIIFYKNKLFFVKTMDFFLQTFFSSLGFGVSCSGGVNCH